MSDCVIACKGVSRHFMDGKNRICVLKDINLHVKKGEVIGIVGASGSGKSTLLNLIGGIDTASQGEVKLMGQDISRLSERERCLIRNRHVGFVYQFHHLLAEFDALENVMMPLCIRRHNTEQAAEQGKMILAQMQLDNRMHHQPSELSGGERQRVAIARALVHQPNCVLADEPTGNLDRENANDVFDLMLKLNQDKQCAFVVVTHDEKLAQRLDRVLTLDGGMLG